MLISILYAVTRSSCLRKDTKFLAQHTHDMNRIMFQSNRVSWYYPDAKKHYSGPIENRELSSHSLFSFPKKTGSWQLMAGQNSYIVIQVTTMGVRYGKSAWLQPPDYPAGSIFNTRLSFLYLKTMTRFPTLLPSKHPGAS